MKQHSLRKAIIAGGLAVGTLDLLDAFIFVGIRSGAQPMGILHSIGAGFLGRDAARVIAYFVMTWFVVPMSNAGNHQMTFALPVTPVMINGMLIHAFGVGLPAAYFASRVD